MKAYAVVECYYRSDVGVIRTPLKYFLNYENAAVFFTNKLNLLITLHNNADSNPNTKQYIEALFYNKLHPQLDILENYYSVEYLFYNIIEINIEEE